VRIVRDQDEPNLKGATMKHGRLTWLRPVDLDPEQRKVYDTITSGPRGRAERNASLTDAEGRLEGPFNAMLFSPELGGALQALGTSIRYSGLLSDRSRELAILLVARASDSDFEWRAHEHAGRAAGLSEAEISDLREGLPPPSLSEAESLAFRVAERLIAERDLPEEVFTEAASILGEGVITELIILVGYYSLLALSMRACRTPLPAGMTPAFKH
jgi:4-carboxymuconolactone decarboxylase